MAQTGVSDMIVLGHSLSASMDMVCNKLELRGDVATQELADLQERRKTCLEFLILFYHTYCDQVDRLKQIYADQLQEVRNLQSVGNTKTQLSGDNHSRDLGHTETPSNAGQLLLPEAGTIELTMPSTALMNELEHDTSVRNPIANLPTKTRSKTRSTRKLDSDKAVLPAEKVSRESLLLESTNIGVEDRDMRLQMEYNVARSGSCGIPLEGASLAGHVSGMKGGPYKDTAEDVDNIDNDQAFATEALVLTPDESVTLGCKSLGTEKKAPKKRKSTQKKEAVGGKKRTNLPETNPSSPRSKRRVVEDDPATYDKVTNVSGEVKDEDLYFSAGKTTSRITEKRRALQLRNPRVVMENIAVELRGPSGRKLHACHLCDKHYIGLSSLKEHKASAHGMDYRYNCQLCGKKFFSDALYLDHLSVHTGERRHKCSTCTKLFATHTNMRRHIHVCNRRIKKNAKTNAKIKQETAKLAPTNHTKRKKVAECSSTKKLNVLGHEKSQVMTEQPKTRDRTPVSEKLKEIQSIKISQVQDGSRKQKDSQSTGESDEKSLSGSKKNKRQPRCNTEPKQVLGEKPKHRQRILVKEIPRRIKKSKAKQLTVVVTCPLKKPQTLKHGKEKLQKSKQSSTDRKNAANKPLKKPLMAKKVSEPIKVIIDVSDSQAKSRLDAKTGENSEAKKTSSKVSSQRKTNARKSEDTRVRRHLFPSRSCKAQSSKAVVCPSYLSVVEKADATRCTSQDTTVATAGVPTLRTDKDTEIVTDVISPTTYDTTDVTGIHFNKDSSTSVSEKWLSTDLQKGSSNCRSCPTSTSPEGSNKVGIASDSRVTLKDAVVILSPLHGVQTKTGLSPIKNLPQGEARVERVPKMNSPLSVGGDAGSSPTCLVSQQNSPSSSLSSGYSSEFVVIGTVSSVKP